MITILNSTLLLGTVSVVNAYSQQHHAIPTAITYPNLTVCSVASETPQYSCENTTIIKNSCCSIAQGGLVSQTQLWNTWAGLEENGQLLPKGSWTIHGLWPNNCNGCMHLVRILDANLYPWDIWTILRSFVRSDAISRCSSRRHESSTLQRPRRGYVHQRVWTSWLWLQHSSKIIHSYSAFWVNHTVNTYWINQEAPNSAFWGHEVQVSSRELSYLIRILRTQFSKHATCTSTFDITCYGSNYLKHQLF